MIKEKESWRKMNKKIAIITGASSGFGLLTTLELAKKDYLVIATMRNLENKEPYYPKLLNLTYSKI